MARLGVGETAATTTVAASAARCRSRRRRRAQALPPTAATAAPAHAPSATPTRPPRARPPRPARRPGAATTRCPNRDGWARRRRETRRQDRPRENTIETLRAMCTQCCRRRPVGEPQRTQKRERGIGRQDVMRQLGRHRFEHQPAAARPGERIAHRRFAPVADAVDDAGQKQQRRRPERKADQRRVVAGRRAVGFLRPQHLVGEIVAQRVFVELRRSSGCRWRCPTGSTMTAASRQAPPACSRLHQRKPSPSA